MTTLNNGDLVKNSNMFECKLCNYITSRKYNLELHNNSKKHKNNFLTTNIAKLSKKYQCENCVKQFNDRAGLWRHKKKCITEDEEKDDKEIMFDGINIKDKDALVLHLLKQNTDLQNKIIDMVSNTNNTNISHNNNTNSNNKTFNLQFFLNETCKNAMNITDFVSSIKMELEDLEYTGRTNYLYLKIVSNSMIGLTKEEGDKNINKIISNVAKNVTIDK
jgi:hypothetical protein